MTKKKDRTGSGSVIWNKMAKTINVKKTPLKKSKLRKFVKWLNLESAPCDLTRKKTGSDFFFLKCRKYFLKKTLKIIRKMSITESRNEVHCDLTRKSPRKFFTSTAGNATVFCVKCQLFYKDAIKKGIVGIPTNSLQNISNKLFPIGLTHFFWITRVCLLINACYTWN